MQFYGRQVCRRGFEMRKLVLSLFCAVWLPSMALADPQPDPQMTIAQVKMEFDIHVRSETGTLFYQCKVEACGVGSVVSQHAQGGTEPPSQAGLENYVNHWVTEVQKRFPTATAEIVRSVVGKLDGKHPDWTFLLAEVHMSTGGKPVDGLSEWWTMGYISDGKGSMTYGSDSSDKEKSWRNANGILSISASQ